MRGQRTGSLRRQIAGNVTRERERAARAPKVMAEVHPDLRRAPPGLTKTQRHLYRRTVGAATWLRPADLPSLLLWVKAFDIVMQAPDLKSVKGEAALAANLGRQLGLTPAGRASLGIEESAPVAKPADPWGKLTVAA